MNSRKLKEIILLGKEYLKYMKFNSNTFGLDEVVFKNKTLSKSTSLHAKHNKMPKNGQI